MDLLEQIPATLDPTEPVSGPRRGRRPVARLAHPARATRCSGSARRSSPSSSLGALLAPIIAPHDPIEQFRDAINAKGDPAGPSARFPLGVDTSGRDYLSRLLYGARTSLLIGIGANIIATMLGLLVGSVAALGRSPRLRVPGGGSIGLPIESMLMRATDLWLAFPVLLLTIAIAAVVGPSVELVIVIIATTLWTATARIVYTRMVILRGSALRRGVAGAGWLRPARLPAPSPAERHAAAASSTPRSGIAATILFETTLSYLGVGVPPPTPTWGTMLADHIGRFVTDPRLVMLPGLAITITVLAFNLLGDSLRDAMDPRSWGAR